MSFGIRSRVDEIVHGDFVALTNVSVRVEHDKIAHTNASSVGHTRVIQIAGHDPYAAALVAVFLVGELFVLQLEKIERAERVAREDELGAGRVDQTVVHGLVAIDIRASIKFIKLKTNDLYLCKNKTISVDLK